MLNRIALCSVEWQYLLFLKPWSIGGNYHHLNSNVHGFIIMVVCRCLCHEEKFSCRRLL